MSGIEIVLSPSFRGRPTVLWAVWGVKRIDQVPAQKVAYPWSLSSLQHELGEWLWVGRTR